MQDHERLLVTLKRLAAAASARHDHAVATSAAANAMSISVLASLRSPEDKRRREAARTSIDAVKRAAPASGNPGWALGAIDWAQRSLDSGAPHRTAAPSAEGHRRSDDEEAGAPEPDESPDGQEALIDVPGWTPPAPSRRSALWLLAAVAGSALLALAWPFVDTASVQPGFFASLSTTSLTVLGIVFSFCIVGTQLVSSPGRISPEHVFRPLTWGYLALFVMSALWGLSLSYYAGESASGDDFCADVVLGSACISIITAGRIALFGFVLSLVLLFPFIRALYRGLTPGAVFTRHGRALARARSASALDSASRRFQRDLLGSVADADYIAEGVALLDIHSSDAVRSNDGRAGRVAADGLAAATSQIFGAANAALRGHPHSLLAALDGHTRWVQHLIEAQRNSKPAVSAKQVTASGLIALNCAIRNLRDWQAGDAPFTVARGSVQLILEMAGSAARSRRRVRLSRAAETLADCAVWCHQQGDERGLTMSLRGLVSLTETSLKARVDIGRSPMKNELVRAVRVLGDTASDQRISLPLSALYHLHNYMHELTARPEESGHMKSLARAFASWPWPGLASLLRGTAEQKKHSKAGSHSGWMFFVYESARRAGLDKQCEHLGFFLHAQYMEEEDLQRALELFDDGVSAYADEAEWATPLVLAQSHNLAEYFESHPYAIPEARVRRRTRAGAHEDRDDRRSRQSRPTSSAAPT